MEKLYDLWANRNPEWETKYEDSIILAGGVSLYGLSDLFLLKGTMIDFHILKLLNNIKKIMMDLQKIIKLYILSKIEHLVIPQKK